MIPSGWCTAAKLVSQMPEKITEEYWCNSCDKYVAHIGKENVEHIKTGCVAINPVLFFREKYYSEFGLCGVNCAYIKATNSADTTTKIVNNLMQKGVRAFSIFVCSLSCPISVLLKTLCDCAREAPECGQKISITVWTEMHSKRLLEYIAECTEYTDTQNLLPKKQQSSKISESSKKKVSSATSSGKILKENREQNIAANNDTLCTSSTAVGVMVPKLFFEFVSRNDSNWLFHEGAASVQLSLTHGIAYNKKYKSLQDKAAGAVSMNARKVLSTLVRASVVSCSDKFMIHLRDSCHSLRATKTGALTVWNDSVANLPIFPNHMGEVPLVCAADVTLQFAAFVNVERTRALLRDNSECCRSAYAILNYLLESHLQCAQQLDFAKESIVVAMSSAVGVIGVHDSIGYDDEDEDSLIVCRPVTASDIERVVVPLIKCGNPIFPMSGILPSILWRVSPGSWTCQQPYWSHESLKTDKSLQTVSERVVVPSGSFARFCEENAVSIDHEDSLKAAAEKYAQRFSYKANASLLSSRVEAQIHQLRKICSSFFSTTSMPLAFTHDDAAEYKSASALLLFLIRVVIKNANNDCPVLLPELRSSETDLVTATVRYKKNKDLNNSEYCGSSGNGFLAKILKRKKPHENALESLEKFFDEIVNKLDDIREAADKPLPLYALQLFQSLVGRKLEQL